MAVTGVLSCITVTALSCLSLLAADRIYLDPIKTVFLPFKYNPKPQFELDKGAIEQIAYDTYKRVVYSVGNSNLHVLDASSPYKLDILDRVDIGKMREFSDVAVCGDFIFTSVLLKNKKDKGEVAVYTYDSKKKSLEFIQFVEVGSQPVSLVVTKDCRKILLAQEGSPFPEKSKIVDPEGTVGIVMFNPKRPKMKATYTEIDFKKFNSRVKELTSAGVRFVFRGLRRDNTLSRDLEPEVITLNKAETLAYVTLQENNAIAVLDLRRRRPEFVKIVPLGSKLWYKSKLDPSDKDGGINIRPWPVLGLFMPSGIEVFWHDGKEYVVVCNEGEAKEIKKGKKTLFTEVKRGKDFVREDLIDRKVPKFLRESLADDSRLGRLQFSTASGAGRKGKFKAFFTFGARSFSIHRAKDLKFLFESGADLEKTIAENFPAAFNARIDRDKTLAQVFDSRSPLQGPEPESVAVGHLFGKTVLFIGSENPGTISIYSLEKYSYKPKFESVFFGAVIKKGQTGSDIYKAGKTGDLEPEKIIVIPPKDSPTGKPLLLVTGSLSGTVTFYEIKLRHEKKPYRKSPYGKTARENSPKEKSPSEKTPKGKPPKDKSPYEESPNGKSPKEKSPYEKSHGNEAHKSPKSPYERSRNGKSPKENSPYEKSPNGKPPKEKSPYEKSHGNEAHKSPKSPYERSRNGKSPKENSPYEKSPNGKSPKEKFPYEKSPYERSRNGKSPNGKSPKEKSPYEQSPDEKPSHERTPKEKFPYEKSSHGKEANKSPTYPHYYYRQKSVWTGSAPQYHR